MSTGESKSPERSAVANREANGEGLIPAHRQFINRPSSYIHHRPALAAPGFLLPLPQPANGRGLSQFCVVREAKWDFPLFEISLYVLNRSNQSGWLSDRAIQIVAESKIRAAIEAGEFDNVPGVGKPAAICDEPYDEFWWIRRKLKREQLQNIVGFQLAGVGKSNVSGLRGECS